MNMSLGDGAEIDGLGKLGGLEAPLIVAPVLEAFVLNPLIIFGVVEFVEVAVWLEFFEVLRAPGGATAPIFFAA